MGKFRKHSLIATATMLLLVPGAQSAFADSFGAISYSPKTRASGWSHSYGSQRQAERVAQSNCSEYAGDCRVAIWFNEACGAVAVGKNGGWGSAWDYNARGAQRAAIAQCSQYAGGCEVVRWQCSGAQ